MATFNDVNGNSITLDTSGIKFSTPNGGKGSIGGDGVSLSMPGVVVDGDYQGNLSATVNVSHVTVTLNDDGSYEATFKAGPLTIKTEGGAIGEVSSGEVSIDVGGAHFSDKFHVDENGHMISEETTQLPGEDPVVKKHDLSTPDGVADSIAGRLVNILTDGLIDKIRQRKAIVDDFDLNQDSNQKFLSTKYLVQRRDPLALDLDGDGLETVGISGSNTVLFDHDGDSLKTGTGWVKGDDAFLALDKNGNGTIDNGNELFGVDTVMANGQKATNGFAALADLDSNKDGVFSSLDTKFGNVRIWRDLNQDGVSQAGELQALAAAGIASINLSSTASNTNLGNGNVLSAAGTFNKTNGQTGSVGEFTTGSTGNLDLAQNPFYSEFPAIPLTTAAAALPGMQGSGAVRDLREAASLNAKVVTDVNDLSGLSRSQMMAKLDTLIEDWASTSSLKTSEERIKAMFAPVNGLPTPVPRLLFRVPGMTDLELQIMQLDGQPGFAAAVYPLKQLPDFNASHYGSMQAEVARIGKMMAVLEKFNGQTFLDYPDDGKSILMGNGQSVMVNPGEPYQGTVMVWVVPVLTAVHVDLLQQSYNLLKQSVYDGLVMQTRLKGYLDAISLKIDETGIRLDFSEMQSKLDTLWQTDKVKAFTDCYDLQNSGSGLAGIGWEGSSKLVGWVLDAANTNQLDSLKAGLATAFAADSAGVPDIKVGTTGTDSLTSGAGNDVLIGLDGNDNLLGGAGNDTLQGGAGDDLLQGGVGDDVFDGGSGNDTLSGEYFAHPGNHYGSGNDTYLFGKGDGQDSIYDADATVGNLDKIIFKKGVAVADVQVVRENDALILKINGTSDSLRVEGYFGADGANGWQVEEIRFTDAPGTVWKVADIKNKAVVGIGVNPPITGAGVIAGTTGSEDISGSNGNDTLNGLAGNDSLGGRDGNDVLNGGEGADSLFGEGGNDTLDGGAGNDYLQGNAGADVYKFGMGSGRDRIYNDDVDALGTNADTILLGSGITTSGITLSRRGDDLLVGVIATGDSLTVERYFYADGGTALAVENLKFADGTIWDINTIKTKVLTGSNGNDSIGGYAGNDTLNGLAGNDSLGGRDGNDVLNGGDGNDTLYGEAGNDKLYGGNGNDLLEGGNSGTSDIVALSTLVVSARASLYNAIGATMEVWADGAKLQTLTVNNTTLSNYTITVPAGTQAKEISVVFTNDAYDAATAQDRNLFVDQIVVNGQVIKGNAVGTVCDYGSGTAARDGFNTYAGSGSLGSNGALHFSLVGTDYLDGGVGADTMRGGVGNDVYAVDNVADAIQENAGGGHDVVRSSVSYTLSDNLEDITLTGTANIDACGNATQNMLVGNNGNNLLDGSGGADFMRGGQGDDIYVVDNANDVTYEAAGAGMDSVESSISWTLQANTDVLTLAGMGNLNATGNVLNNLLRGNAGVNVLNGGAGNDILEGGAGNDILTDTSGTALFNGGAGADTLNGGAGAEIFLGGLGNDTYRTGAGNDIVLFNKGDGQDTFAAGGTGSDTLSLGGGISYADLSLSKSANDLVLKVGSSDQITFKDWYATTSSKPVANLQVIADAMAGFVAGGSDPLKNQKVEKFNFAGLVGAFDTARAANSGLTSWALTSALSNFQLAGSDTAALGGDLAYQYGKNGSLAGIGATPALSTLSDSNLGSAAQTLSPLAGLQTGSARLS